MSQAKFQFHCVECGVKLKADYSKAGMTFDCPRCSTPVVVPGSWAPDQPSRSTQHDPVYPPEVAEQPNERRVERTCPYCAEPIALAARKCKHCGEILDPMLRDATAIAGSGGGSASVKEDRKDPGIAAVLSLVIPGAGHLYVGDIGIGLVLFLVTFFGYLLVLPGLIAHLVSIFLASSAAKAHNAKL